MVNHISFQGRETLLTKPAKQVAEDVLHKYVPAGKVYTEEAAQAAKKVATEVHPHHNPNAVGVRKAEEVVDYFPPRAPYIPEKGNTVVEEANKVLAPTENYFG